MIKTVKHQVSFILRQNTAIFVFYILLAVALRKFVSNVLIYQGSDVIDMCHPAKMLSLSFNQVFETLDALLLLIQLYPVVVVCPAGFILFLEKNRKEDVLLITRIGSVKYYMCKTIASFLATMIIFTVPFLIELGLNCLSFPLGAEGDFVNLNRYDPDYISLIENYIFPNLYHLNPYLYALMGIFLFGIFSGVMAMFTVALSGIIKLQYRIFLFLPVFIMLNIASYIPETVVNGIPFSINWYNYVSLFDHTVKNETCFFIFLLLLIVVSFVCSFIKGKVDQL